MGSHIQIDRERSSGRSVSDDNQLKGLPWMLDDTIRIVAVTVLVVVPGIIQVHGYCGHPSEQINGSSSISCPRMI